MTQRTEGAVGAILALSRGRRLRVVEILLRLAEVRPMTAKTLLQRGLSLLGLLLRLRLLRLLRMRRGRLGSVLVEMRGEVRELLVELRLLRCLILGGSVSLGSVRDLLLRLLLLVRRDGGLGGGNSLCGREGGERRGCGGRCCGLRRDGRGDRLVGK